MFLVRLNKSILKIEKEEEMIKTKLKDNNCGELNLNNLNEEVTLSGWASTIRDLCGFYL